MDDDDIIIHRRDDDEDGPDYSCLTRSAQALLTCRAAQSPPSTASGVITALTNAVNSTPRKAA